MNLVGIKCRAFLDAGAGRSYMPFPIKPIEEELFTIRLKQEETMFYTITIKLEVYEVEVSNLKGNINITTDLKKVNKPQLISLPNLCYQDMIQELSHLEGVNAHGIENKTNLPIHMILGTSYYTRTKTKHVIQIGTPGQSIAEYTAFG